MPGGDRTGPRGGGQMTGGAQELCAGDHNPYPEGRGFYPGEGRRNRFGGGGRGMCRRAGWAGSDYPSSPQSEQDFLTQRKEALQNQLSEITQRLNALSAVEGKEG